MCKPQKLLSQQTEIKDNFKNLTFWGFTLTCILSQMYQHLFHVVTLFSGMMCLVCYYFDFFSNTIVWFWIYSTTILFHKSFLLFFSWLKYLILYVHRIIFSTESITNIYLDQFLV